MKKTRNFGFALASVVLVLAFRAAATSAVACGLAAGWWWAAEKITIPTIQTLQSVPGLAWIPAAINKPICENVRD